mmetsp:Transcript_26803/g.30123  ORF Transcript_26803/g.30123 Transcript_26803/m.30123 type:complete len:81 (+) Transcript_26803:165-407(+)
MNNCGRITTNERTNERRGSYRDTRDRRKLAADSIMCSILMVRILLTEKRKNNNNWCNININNNNNNSTQPTTTDDANTSQ